MTPLEMPYLYLGDVMPSKCRWPAQVYDWGNGRRIYLVRGSEPPKEYPLVIGVYPIEPYTFRRYY